MPQMHGITSDKKSAGRFFHTFAIPNGDVKHDAGEKLKEKKLLKNWNRKISNHNILSWFDAHRRNRSVRQEKEWMANRRNEKRYAVCGEVWNKTARITRFYHRLI